MKRRLVVARLERWLLGEPRRPVIATVGLVSQTSSGREVLLFAELLVGRAVIGSDRGTQRGPSLNEGRLASDEGWEIEQVLRPRIFVLIPY